jgi:hypothetical protein
MLIFVGVVPHVLLKDLGFQHVGSQEQGTRSFVDAQWVGQEVT